MRRVGEKMPFKIVRNDITAMDVDVIVNPVGENLISDGGVSKDIFDAGDHQLVKACGEIGHCDTGAIVMTEGFELRAEAVIHTVGPVWQGGNGNEASILAGCYSKALGLARDKGFETIAFPLIASGAYGYPKGMALSIATKAINEFLEDHEMMVYLVVYDQSSFDTSQSLYGEIEAFIDEVYIDETRRKSTSRRVLAEESLFEFDSVKEAACAPSKRFDDIQLELEETFSERLLRLIDESSRTDVEVYKKANVSRKLFSKIRSKTDYKTSKNTAIAFAIALELNLDETQDLLGKAGYILSRSQEFDVIIEYFINNEIYDVIEMNEALFYILGTTL